MFTTNAPASFSIDTLVYEGPLDLLVQLIDRAELEITAIAIATVTDQFLKHIRSLAAIPAEEISAFLVMASRLVQIKSEALLPRPPQREPGEEDPAEDLARQLIEYKRYKQIAALLHQQQVSGNRTYLRLAPPPKMESRLDLTGIGVRELWYAALDVFSRTPDQEPLASVVSRPKVTIRQKIRAIVRRIREFGRASFTDILGDARSKIDVVVAFLAMLELIKRERVAAVQPELFGEIEIIPAEAWDDATDFELEFGE
ncbi:MAG TPA: segregation/condensation protein A [Anaerolineales bacterium]|nr:segregation/condensation protein A [Anaerolineales bacterium]